MKILKKYVVFEKTSDPCAFACDLIKEWVGKEVRIEFISETGHVVVTAEEHIMEKIIAFAEKKYSALSYTYFNPELLNDAHLSACEDAPQLALAWRLADKISIIESLERECKIKKENYDRYYKYWTDGIAEKNRIKERCKCIATLLSAIVNPS